MSLELLSDYFQVQNVTIQSGMVILKAQHTSFTPTNVNINVVFNKQIVLSKKKRN